MGVKGEMYLCTNPAVNGRSEHTALQLTTLKSDLRLLNKRSLDSYIFEQGKYVYMYLL